jgi:nucleotide-binding universal stress UspA family protein
MWGTTGAGSKHAGSRCRKGAKVKHSVAVGVDGSQSSGQALRWAVSEARLRGARVAVVTAWTFPSLVMPSSIPHNLGTMLREQARATLEGMLAALGEETQGLEIERLVVEGDPAVRLIELSTTADLLVVGSRGLGGFRELLLGSVSHHCATHARCPVVVIRREDPRARAEMQGPIVAGIDGSPSSLEALVWAAREARLRGAALHVVSAWSIPWNLYSNVGLPDGLAENLRQAAEETLTKAIEGLGPERDDLDIRAVVEEAEAAHILIRTGRGAQLLVVGCRGFGGFRELLLGSVSQQCAHHAECPVVIVRKLCAGEDDSSA